MCCPEGYVFFYLLFIDLKTGIDFPHFGLELGVVLEGTMQVYEHISHFISK